MTSSDERREVAERLRDWADRYPQGDFTWGVLGSVHYRIDGVDTRPSSNQEVLYMLADLIDPVGQVVDNGVDSFCSECDYVLDPDEVIEAKYCPGCGARLVSNDDN